MNFSDKFGQMGSNILLDLDYAKKELEKEGREVINFSIGTPDFPPDKHVMEAISEAFKDPENYKYGMTESPQLIEAVSCWYKDRYGVELKGENICAVNGSQEGIAHIAFPLCNPEDVVLVPDPCYQIFSFGPSMADIKLEYMPLLKENDYIIDLDAINPEVAKAAKIMIVSYPNNPTTATAPVEFYKRVVEFAKKYDIIVIHDNAYSEFIYDDMGRGISFLSIEGAMDVGIEFNSLSKTYNLTGLRLSFALGNSEIIKRFRAFRSQIDYGICMGIQIGAIAALTGPQDSIEKNRFEYQRRRNALCDGLNSIGWKVPKTTSTMFSWFPIPDNYSSDSDFTFDLLKKAGVLVVPGSSFGKHGAGYVRMALVQPIDKIKKAVENIAESGILNN